LSHKILSGLQRGKRWGEGQVIGNVKPLCIGRNLSLVCNHEELSCLIKMSYPQSIPVGSYGLL
jgi:hypothetical protein